MLCLLLAGLAAAGLVIAASPANAARKSHTDQIKAEHAGQAITVPDQADFQQALDRVADGGVITMLPGVYAAPPGGFRISDRRVSFTVRAAPGGAVILDGRGATDILRLQNSTADSNSLVRFEGLTFANGYSNQDGVGGGVTIQRARADFRTCRFLQNRGEQPTTGGGAASVGLGASVTFSNCRWEENGARNEGGALAIGSDSLVVIHASSFVRNNTNQPGHRNTAAGGAVHVGNGRIYVYNTAFTENTAGCIGGAIFVIGDWASGRLDSDRPGGVENEAGGAYAYLQNTTFTENATRPDASTACLFLEGGAIHLEDESSAHIVNSTLIGNESERGGGLNLYRASATIDTTYFADNRASGRAVSGGFGGAIAAVSNDVADTSTAGGLINRRPATLSVHNSLIRGSQVVRPQTAAGIYIAGDGNRAYGLGGVAQQGSLDDNRAILVVEQSVFIDTDVAELNGQPGSGTGGAVVTDLATISMTDTLIVQADAAGAQGAGGGLALLNNSVALLDRIQILDSSAERFGGAIFLQGSRMELRNCLLAGNEISPGVDEVDPTQSFGAAIFSGPDVGRGLGPSGVVDGCIISANRGQPLFDDDREPGPPNQVQYNRNRIHTSFGNSAYTNSLPNQCCKSVQELNQLVIARAGAVETDKSTVPNLAETQPVEAGVLTAVLDSPAGTAREALNLAYAWSGAAEARLNGTVLSGTSGVLECDIESCDGSRTYTLTVGETAYSITVSWLTIESFLPLLADIPALRAGE